MISAKEAKKITDRDIPVYTKNSKEIKEMFKEVDILVKKAAINKLDGIYLVYPNNPHLVRAFMEELYKKGYRTELTAQTEDDIKIYVSW